MPCGLADGKAKNGSYQNCSFAPSAAEGGRRGERSKGVLKLAVSLPICFTIQASSMALTLKRALEFLETLGATRKRGTPPDDSAIRLPAAHHGAFLRSAASRTFESVAAFMGISTV